MIEQIEEFRAELHILLFTNPRQFRYREIKVRLTRPANDADTRGTEVRAVTDRRRSAKRAEVKKARRVRIAYSAKPVLDVARCRDLVIAHPGTKLRPAHSLLGGIAVRHPVNGS